MSAPQQRSSNVEVAIRIRPLRQEIGETNKVSWEVQNRLLVEKANPDCRFTFDRIYDQSSATVNLYTNSVRDNIVKSVAKGYNGTVFAYGQTGSGKSFTMLGDGLQGHNEGVVSMAIKDLFIAIEQEKAEKKAAEHQDMTVNVYVAMLEIYNEQLRDLLVVPGSVAQPLAIRENEHGVYVHNALRRQVKNARECLEIIHNEAESRRVSASTAMNDRSSRSHCLIRILVEKTIHYDDDDDDSSDGEEIGIPGASTEKKIVSSLNLVDLAGSERVAKTGATGQRMVEGGHINKSLTILTTVINRLTEQGTKAVTHVPYRDSKLTHLLKTALGGNSFTTVFCCMTIAEEHTDESRSTLQFAARAKTIRNQVSMNEVADQRTRLREMELELRKYKKMNVATTIYLWARDAKIRRLTGRTPGASVESGGADSRQNTNVSVDGAAVPSAPTGGGGNNTIVMKDGEVVDLDQVEQMQMLIEQLTVQNEELQDELTDSIRQLKLAQSAAKSAPPSATFNDPMFGVADDLEKRQLKKDIEDMQLMLEELEKEGKTNRESMEELEAVVEDLEDENEEKDNQIAEANKKVRKLEVQLQTAQSHEKGYKEQIDQLQKQMTKRDEAELEKARGDELLEKLTKLHMDHQALQFEHNELLNMHTRSETEVNGQVALLNERVSELQAEKSHANQATQLANSYCWRLLNVAHLAVHGKSLSDADGELNVTAPIREHQVDQAVKSLTSFVNSHSSKPPTVVNSVAGGDSSNGSVGTAAGAAAVSAAADSNITKTVSSRKRREAELEGAPTFKNEAEYKKKIIDLEKIILTKDAQRDIIIDTKLKRIQELVLRLQSTNLRLAQEVRGVTQENHNLFEIIKKEPKLVKSLNKTNYQPVSEDEIMMRAVSAPVPQRPHGHN